MATDGSAGVNLRTGGLPPLQRRRRRRRRRKKN
jgi:hypothetical protein